jgi:hypothetical protein
MAGNMLLDYLLNENIFEYEKETIEPDHTSRNPASNADSMRRWKRRLLERLQYDPLFQE